MLIAYWKGGLYHRGMSDELSEAENGGSSMMIYVQELKRFLLKEEEYGIDQFDVFRQIIQLL